MKLEGLATVLGLELQSLGDQRFSCRYFVVSKKSSRLTIEKHGSFRGTLSSVLSQLPKNVATAVVLSGKGIVHKSLTAPTEEPDDQLFASVFPSVEQQQFYTQFFREGEAALVSVARKQEVDELVDKLIGVGLQVFTVSFGPMVTELVWSQFNSYSAEIRFDGHVFNLTTEQRFMSYRYDHAVKNEFPLKIGSQPIAEENIVAYSAAFQLLMFDHVTPILADVDRANDQFAAFISKAALKQKALLFLFTLFGALLISFLVFSYYNQQNAILMKEVGSRTASLDQTEFLQKNIVQNQALLEKLNWANGYNYGHIINQIGKTLPRQLTLIDISVNQFKTEEEKSARRPMINITGFTDNLTAVNNWIFVLKEEKWIKTVKLIKYQEDEETGNYQFNLLINY